MNKVETLNQSNIINLYKREKKLRTSISKLTHEIKNPLAVCNGYLEMMNEKDEIIKEKYLNIVKKEIERTLNVINDFSFFSKEKVLEKEELDLKYLLEDILNITKPLIEEKHGKIILFGEEELYLNGDYKRLKQAFINIIKNSVEASENNLEIVIKIINHKNEYEIRVKDNGCGMSKEELNYIFNDFYTTKPLGTGLGVSYMKEIIELHDGKIEYKSKKGVGTTVIINLPKEKSPKTFNSNN